MKQILLFVLALAFGITATAQETIPVNSQITDATVFLSGAQLTHEAKVTVKNGNTEIVFKNLANGINPKSIQVAAPPEVIIVSAVHAINYIDGHEMTPRLKQMEDSVKMLTHQLELLTNEKTVLEAERTMILANQNQSGKETALTAEQLAKSADFFRTRLTDIYALLQKNKDKNAEISEKVQKLNQQMAELNYKKSLPSNDVVVTVTCFQPRTFTLRLNYFTTQGSWTPRYDLRAKDTQNPVQLDYRADVRQQTGLDWKTVKLKLSSGNPNVSGTKPELNTWSLYVQTELYNKGGRTSGVYNAAPSVSATREEAESKPLSDQEGDEAYEFGDNSGLANFTQMIEGATTAEFVIQLPQDIPSDGKSHQVMVQSSELPAQYRHFAVPKLDTDAFLTARVTQWEKLNLLPGPANIFFEGTFIGEAYIDPNFTKDTLDFSLGRDKKVVITREQIKDRHASRFIGLVREKTFAYEITVRNTKKDPIHLTIEDQVPVSQDKDIEVKLEEKSGGTQDEITGKITWELDIKPAESVKRSLIFSVKHPKNKNVPGI